MNIEKAVDYAKRSKAKLKDPAVSKDILIDVIKTLHEEIRRYDKSLDEAMKTEIENTKLRSRVEELEKYESLYKQLASKPKSGRKPVPNEKRQYIERLRGEGKSVRAISEAVGVSRSAVGRICKAIDKNN